MDALTATIPIRDQIAHVDMEIGNELMLLQLFDKPGEENIRRDLRTDLVTLYAIRASLLVLTTKDVVDTHLNLDELTLGSEMPPAIEELPPEVVH